MNNETRISLILAMLAATQSVAMKPNSIQTPRIEELLHMLSTLDSIRHDLREITHPTVDQTLKLQLDVRERIRITMGDERPLVYMICDTVEEIQYDVINAINIFAEANTMKTLLKALAKVEFLKVVLDTELKELKEQSFRHGKGGR